MGVNPKSSRGRSRRQNSEINITPMVDVMLVLLIVFMVTAPLMTVGVPVDLPKTQSKQVKSEKVPLVITVQKSGALYIQEVRVNEKQMLARLRAIHKENPDLKVFVRGDSNVAYGEVLRVMGRISASGFTKVALITEQLKR